MAHSTSDSGARKTHPDFPLTLRKSDGRWQKKIRGKVHYFTGTEQQALDEWLRVKDDLLAGRKPREKDGTITVMEVCDRFLVAKQRQVSEGSLKQLSWNDYKATCDRIVGHFGKTRSAVDLRGEDFEGYRAAIAKKWGLVATSNEVNRVRVVFKYAYDSDLLDRPVKFGPQFKRAPKKVLKKQKAKHVAEHGKNLLESADVRALIDKALPAMKAMILLAINTGMGNSDVGRLPLSAINRNTGWLAYPRPKTGEDRRCPLWQETLDAIREYLPKRPKPKTVEVEKLLFVTRCGEPWAKEDSFDNPITKEFRKLLGELKLHRPRIGFYTLRHTFRTIAGGAKDQPAANLIMGHADGSMAEVYTENIGDDRLLAVSHHVRIWLFDGIPEKKDRKRPSRSTVGAKHLRVVG